MARAGPGAYGQQPAATTLGLYASTALAQTWRARSQARWKPGSSRRHSEHSSRRHQLGQSWTHQCLTCSSWWGNVSPQSFSMMRAKATLRNRPPVHPIARVRNLGRRRTAGSPGCWNARSPELPGSASSSDAALCRTRGKSSWSRMRCCMARCVPAWALPTAFGTLALLSQKHVAHSQRHGILRGAGSLASEALPDP